MNIYELQYRNGMDKPGHLSTCVLIAENPNKARTLAQLGRKVVTCNAIGKAKEGATPRIVATEEP